DLVLEARRLAVGREVCAWCFHPRLDRERLRRCTGQAGAGRASDQRAFKEDAAAENAVASDRLAGLLLQCLAHAWSLPFCVFHCASGRLVRPPAAILARSCPTVRTREERRDPAFSDADLGWPKVAGSGLEAGR